MKETWYVTFQATVDVDTSHEDHPYKQIFDAVRDNNLSGIRIVSADPLLTIQED